MSNLLGPSAVPPRLTEEQASRARMFDGPIYKAAKVVGIASLMFTGIAVALIGSVAKESIRGNTKKRR